MAKARKKPRNSQRSAPAENSTEVSFSQSKVVPAEHPHPDDGGEHEQAADEGVEEELHRGVLAAQPTEGADEEVHRHQHDLEEYVEEEHVGGGEDADHRGLEREQQREVRVRRTLGRLAGLRPASRARSRG